MALIEGGAAQPSSTSTGTPSATTTVPTSAHTHAVALDGGASATENAHTHAAGAFTGTALVMSGYVAMSNPLAAELVSIVADVQIADGAQIIASQPLCPCKLQVRITDAANACTGDLVLVGVGARGQAVTQTIAITGGTRTVTTTEAYATLTSATVVGSAGTGAGINLGIGVSGALGLPGAQLGSGFAVYRAHCDLATDAVGAVDAAAGTISPTTATNGAHDYEFWYSYSVTPAGSVAVSAAGSAHSHGPGTLADAASAVPSATTTVASNAHTHAEAM